MSDERGINYVQDCWHAKYAFKINLVNSYFEYLLFRKLAKLVIFNEIDSSLICIKTKVYFYINNYI